MAAHRRLQRLAAQLVGTAAAADEPELTHAEAHRRSLALMAQAVPPTEPWRSQAQLQLTPEQLAAWETFGYLSLPGLLSDRADQIINDFEEVWAAYGGGHDGQPHDGESRSCIVPFCTSCYIPSSAGL